MNAALSRAASASHTPVSTVIPCARSVGIPFAADPLIGVLQRAHHSCDARIDDALRAGSGAADMTAGFERDVQRGTACAVSGLCERVDLGVRFACAFVPALSDHDTVGRHHHGPDHRIGRGAALPTRRVKEGTTHVSFVDRSTGYHFS